MAQVSLNKCGSCNGQNGTLYCRDCQLFYCQTCKPLHDKFPANKQHRMIDAYKEGRCVFKPNPVCDDHKKQFLYYCTDCDCLICSDCIISIHNLHKCCNYINIVEQRRQNAFELIGTIKAKVQILEESITKIKMKTLPQIISAANDFDQQVNDLANEIGSVIDCIKHVHKTTASDFQSTETEKMTEVRANLESLHKQYKEVLVKFENVLLEPSSVTFFFEHKAIENEIDNLDKIPEIPTADRIPDLNPDMFIDQIIKKLEKKFTISSLEEKKEENVKLTKMIEEAEHNMTQHKQSCQAEIKQYVERSSQLNREKQQLEQEIASLAKKNKDDTSQLNETLLNERTKLLERKTELDSTLKENKEENVKLKKIIEEAEHEMVQHKLSCQAEIKQYVERLTQLNREKQQIEQENARLSKKIKDDTSQLNDTLLKEKTKTSELKKDLDRTLKENMEETGKLKKMIEEAEHNMIQHKLNSQAQSKQYCDRSIQLNKEKQQLEQEYARLAKKNLDETSNLNSILLMERNKLSELQRQHDSTLKETNEVIGKLNKMIATEHKIIQQNLNYQAESKQYAEMLTQINREKQLLEQENARLAKKNWDDTSQLNQTLSIERTKLSQLQTELDSCRQGAKDGCLFMCLMCSNEYVFPINL